MPSGLGAVLSQPLDDNVNYPIAYASRSLSPAESNYNINQVRDAGSSLGCNSLQNLPLWSRCYSLL